MLDPRRGHAGLDHVVLGLELVAVRSIALPEPAGRAVDADPARHHAVRPARLPQRVPELEPLLHRHVELPAQVADVGDARGEDALRADLDDPARSELETIVRYVVGCGAGEDVACTQAPDADGR